uniref:NADH-ubiquinone oxidoreductase chain 6 n=1 Tax=Thalassa montezumae TaxID=3129753 RepID=A0AAU7LK36_9CUCU
MILMMMFLSSSMIMFLNHPLSIGSIILIQTILNCMFIGMNYLNFWYSYILMLIMIGGLLILFIYMTSIASNEKFKFNPKLVVYLIILMFMFYLINWTFIFNNDLMNLFSMNLNFNLSMSKFYNYPELKIMFMVIFYLLICMIAVVKICKIKSGPLRQMFYENTNSKNFSYN